MLRFVVSTSAHMHINDLKTALINYIIAQKQGEKFILLLDDLNRDTTIIGMDGDALDILKNFAITNDGVIYKRDSLKSYQNFAYKLLKEKKAYACICGENQCKNNCKELTEQEIQNFISEKRKFVIKVEALDNLPILNLNSEPTKLFSCAIDNMSMNITTVADIEKNFINIDKELYIQHLLRYNIEINSVYFGKILDEDKTLTIKELLKQGFLPDAIINYILSESDKNIFYLPEYIDKFSVEDIKKDDTEFDIELLKSINREHLNRLDSKILSQIFGFSDSSIGELIKLYLDKFRTINELNLKVKEIFSPKSIDNRYKTDMIELSKTILNSPMIDNFEDFKSYLLKHSSLDKNRLEVVLKLLLTNSSDCPELEKIYKYIKPYLLEVARCQL